MSEERKLFKNIASMSLSMIVPNFLNLLLIAIVSQILLKSGMNDYGAVLNYVTMFALMADFGLSTVFIRDVAKENGKMSPYFSTLLTLRIFTSVAMIVIALFLANFMPYDKRIVNYIFIFGLSQLIFQFGQIFLGPFQASEKMEYITYGSLLQASTFFIMSLFFVYRQGMGVPGLLYASLVANMVMLVAYAYFTHKNITRINFKLDSGLARYLILAGIPFGIYNLFYTLTLYLDKNLLGVLRFSDIANYTLPYNLVNALTFIPMAFGIAVFPLFSKMVHKNSDSMKYACEMSFKYLILLILPICVGTTLLADRIAFSIWRDSSFSGTIPVLQILIWGIAFVTLNTIPSTLLNASHRERSNMKNMGICLVVNAIMNLALIPVFGAIGSSIAYVFGICILNFILTAYLVRDELKGIDFVRPLVTTGVASLAMAAFIWFVHINNLPLYVIFSAIVYFAVFLLIGGLSKEDIALIKNILFHNTKKTEDTSSKL